MATGMYQNEPNASQFGGGGFMQSPAAAEGQGTSPAGERKGSSSLIPLTIKQLANACEASHGDDNQITVNGQDVSNITLVGRIVEARNQSTSLQYTIDDGTGKCQVMYWIDGDDGVAAQSSEWTVGKYVRVFGNVRHFQNKMSVVAFTIKPITDFNEITFHMIECIYVHMHQTGGVAGAMGAAPAGGGMQQPAMGGAAAPSMAAQGGGGAVEGAADIETAVMAIFNSPEAHASERGFGPEDLLPKLNNRFTREQLLACMEKCTQDGHLYSTTDDYHYKSTCF